MRIGVFDSGIGGITVLNHLREHFKGHEYLYFGDTANVPYGSKSVEQIKELCCSAALRMKEHRIEVLIVACNTASSLALPEMREVMGSVPVLGVVEAGVHSILEVVQDIVLVLGTRATIKSQIYSKLLRSHLPKTKVFEQACPLLVPMIEEGWVKHPILIETVNEYVRPYVSLAAPHRGVALLACTHYPWIKPVFEKALPGWRVIDSAEAIGHELQNKWKAQEAHPTQVSWYFSDPDSIATFVSIQEPIEKF